MPNVVGLEYLTVEKQLGNDFTIRVKYYYDENEVGGIIKEQSIEPDTYYDPAQKPELELLVSGGSPNVPVPEFAGMMKKDYLEVLDALNIKYKVVDVVSDKAAVGYVDSTSIKPGQTINVEKGTVLTVNISKALVTKKTTTTSETTAKPDEPEPQNTTTAAPETTTTTTTTTTEAPPEVPDDPEEGANVPSVVIR